MGSYEILDHTADIALKIIGDNIEDFFRQAFEGFLAVTELDSAQVKGAARRYKFIIKGNDEEDLLVGFINELIRMLQEMETAPLKIEDLTVRDGQVSCLMNVARVDKYPDGYVEMKSATYHMLDIANQDGKLVASLIIDI